VGGADRPPASLVESYQDNTDALFTAHDVCALAVIAKAKYRSISRAVGLLAAGLGVLAVAGVLSVVA